MTTALEEAARDYALDHSCPSIERAESKWQAEQDGDRLAVAVEALRLVATGKRPDGTYNRCREACEELARKALRKIERE